MKNGKELKFPAAHIGGPEDPDTKEFREKFFEPVPAEVPVQSWDKKHSFSKLLEPLGIDKFLGEYWERKPLHLKAPDTKRFSKYLSMETMKDLITRRGIPSQFMDLMDPKQNPVGLKKEHAYDPERVIREIFINRCSVVLNNLMGYEPNVSEFAQNLTEWTGRRIQANAYFTLRGNQTFKWHWDNHGTFIIQTHGKKEWFIYEPKINQPLLSHDCNMWPAFNMSTSKLAMNFVMEEGDLLYVPSAHPHYAKTLDTHDSLHVTFGLMETTWHDVVTHVLQAALKDAESDIRLRQSVDVKDAGEIVTSRRKELEEKIQSVFKHVDLDDADLAFFGKQLLQKPMSIQKLRMMWDSLEKPENHNDKSGIVKLVDFHLREKDEVVEVIAQQRKIFFPAALQGCLRFIKDNQNITVAQLKDLPTESDRVRFARSLAEHGLIALF